jgi:hypothetical protein
MADIKTFGVMLFEGFEVLDVFGPLEAFGILAAEGKCRVVTVAERAGAVTSAQGPKVIADFGFTESGFNDCPPIDILLVPGGIGTRKEVTNHTALEWLIAHAQKAEIAGKSGPPGRTPRDLQQIRIQVGDGAGPQSEVGPRGAMGRRREVLDLLGRVGRHRHGAGNHRAHHRPRDRGAHRSQNGIRVASRRGMGPVFETSPAEVIGPDFA